MFGSILVDGSVVLVHSIMELAELAASLRER